MSEDSNSALISALQPESAEARNQLTSGRRKRVTVPPESRKRVKLACIICRRNKLKCDGQTPCQRCQTVNKPCQYPEQDALNSEVATSRDRVGFLEELLQCLRPDIETDVESLRSHVLALREISRQPMAVEAGEHSTQTPESHFSPSKSLSKALVDGESGPIVLEAANAHATSIMVHNQGKTHFDGGSSHWAFFDGVRNAVTGTETADTPSHEKLNYQHFLNEANVESSIDDSRTRVLAALPPRNVVDFLVKTFFGFTQANFFYIHPEIFNRKLSAFYEGRQEFDRQKDNKTKSPAGFTCVLFMVMAIGSQFAELESGPNTDSSVELPLGDSRLDFSKIPIPAPSPNPGWRFYEFARKLLPDVISSSSMTSVQACALQGAFLLSTNARDVSYNVMGLGLRMAINMGMHRSTSTSNLHPHVRELRNRLWWSIYSAERLFSIEMGRPLAIDDAEIDAPFPADLPELRVDGRQSSVSNQIAMAQLCQIMGRIVKMIYSNKITSKNGQVIYPKPFKQLQTDLEQWKLTLPEHLKLSHDCTRAVFHLHLTYEQAIILLTRTSLNHAVVKNHITQVSTETAEFLHQNAQDCLSAARSSIRIMTTLKDRALLSRFSFHDFLYCSAALFVLLLGAKLETPGQTTKSTFIQGMAVLFELAKGSEAAVSSLRLISRGFQSCLKQQPVALQTATTSGERSEEGRIAWQAWMSQNLTPASPVHQPSAQDSPFSEPFATPAVYREENSNEDIIVPRTTQNTIPVFQNDNLSIVSDTQPFWLPDLESDYVLPGRDLAAVPSMDFFNHSDVWSLGLFGAHDEPKSDNLD